MVPSALRPRRSTAWLSVLFPLLSGGCVTDGRAVVRLPAVAAPYVVSGALGGRTSALLTVSDGAARVEVAFAALPGVLYRISTPSGSGLVPVVHMRGARVLAGLRRTGGDGPDTVRIVLNRAVRWAISLPAGAGDEWLDLRGGRVSGLALGACGSAEVRLPAPLGTVPVTFTAGVGRVVLRSPRAPARIVFAAGAGGVATPWGARTSPGVGEIVGDPGWGRAADRYAVTAYAAIGNLTFKRD